MKRKAGCTRGTITIADAQSTLPHCAAAWVHRHRRPHGLHSGAPYLFPPKAPVGDQEEGRGGRAAQGAPGMGPAVPQTAAREHD